MPDKAHEQVDEKLVEMEKRLTAIYRRAQADLEEKARKYFDRFEALDEKKRKELEAGKITEEEYKRWRKNRIMNNQRYHDMQEELARNLLEVNQTAAAYINGESPEIYAIGYNALEDELSGVQGYSFSIVDADTVRLLSQEDGSLLPPKKIDPKKDIPWNMSNINGEVLQGILQGDSMPQIAKRLRNVQEMNRKQAIRSARTIVTGAENKGRLESYKKAEADGIMLKKEWVATFDIRTRHAHALLDGKIQDVDKPFKSEFGDIMYPGDHTADPADVYNCRCTLVSRVVGFNGKTISGALEKERDTVVEWREKEQERDPEKFSAAVKKLQNKSQDKEQYDRYRHVLGREMPKGGLEWFQNLKYTDKDAYDDLKAFYLYKSRVPNATREDFERYQEEKRKKQEEKRKKQAVKQ